MATIEKKRRASAKGQALIIVVLALTVLLVFTGLALDGGLAYSTRRQMQNAADASALAGARAVLLSHSNTEVYSKTLEYSITRNRADSVLGKYYPGNEAIQANGSIPEDATGVCVTTSSTYNTLFMGLIGYDSLDIDAEACASATHRCPGPGYAIWAHAAYHGSNCKQVIDWPGSNIAVTGNVHSNGNLYIGGSNNSVTGRAEYVQGPAGGGSGNTVTPTATAYATAMPVTIVYERYLPEKWDNTCFPNPPCLIRPWGEVAKQLNDDGDFYHIVGNKVFSQSDPEGLYYIEGKAEIGISNFTKRITIISENEIKVSGSKHNLTPYVDDGILFYSNWNRSPPADRTCNDSVINISGSGSSWNGIVYAPNGMIEISGSGNSTMSGSLLAQAVKLSGSNWQLNYSDEYCPTVDAADATRLILP